MSTVNHWDKLRDDFIDWANELAAADEVPPLPKYDGDLHAFFDTWISQGSFPWQGDGAPWWSHFHHASTWWELRDRPNVLFVHFNDLLADLGWPISVTSRSRRKTGPRSPIGAPTRRSRDAPGVLSENELRRYDERAAEVLTPGSGKVARTRTSRSLAPEERHELAPEVHTRETTRSSGIAKGSRAKRGGTKMKGTSELSINRNCARIGIEHRCANCTCYRSSAVRGVRCQRHLDRSSTSTAT